MTRPAGDASKSLPENRVLVGVRVPSSFHQRIQAECLRRGLSLQEMVTEALERLFRGPMEYDYEVTSYVIHDSKLSEAELNERKAALTLFVKYLDKMPREKLRVLTAAMEWDLRVQKSSRLRPRQRKAQPARWKE